MPTALLLTSTLAACLYWARAGLGDGLVPLGEAAPVVRMVALLVLLAALVAALVRRPAAPPAFGRGFARYELGSGITAAAPPPRSRWRPLGFTLGALLIGSFGASYAFDDTIEWRASVERNAARRAEGVRRYFARRSQPSTEHVDWAIESAMREPDYVKAGCALAAMLPAPQRGRVLARLLDKISRERRDRAIEAIAAVVPAFPSPEHARAARRVYADYVARPWVSTRDAVLPEGARALLTAFGNAVARGEDPVLGIVAKPAPAPTDEAAETVRALAALVAVRIPFELRQGEGPAPVRLELRWSVRSDRLVVVAKLVGAPRDLPFEGEYPATLGAGAGRAVAEAIGHDLLP